MNKIMSKLAKVGLATLTGYEIGQMAHSDSPSSAVAFLPQVPVEQITSENMSLKQFGFIMIFLVIILIFCCAHTTFSPKKQGNTAKVKLNYSDISPSTSWPQEFG